MSEYTTRRGFLIGLGGLGAAASLPSLAKASTVTMSATDVAFLREEEKLARDVYLTLYDRWGFQVFGNIAMSEQRHTDAVRYLLDRYGIADPVVDDQVGRFTHPDIQALYDQLVQLGQQSEIDALVVGATIEDLDILDISEMLHHTDAPDITQVLENLRCGSHNHARAFIRNLDNYGVVYEPQYNTPDEWAAVLSATSPDCEGAMRRGRGRRW